MYCNLYGHCSNFYTFITNFLPISSTIEKGMIKISNYYRGFTLFLETSDFLSLYCLVAESCPTLCDPKDYSLSGFSVHKISQARILEWVAISFSWGSSQTGDLPKPGSNPYLLHWQSDSLPLSHQGSFFLYIWSLLQEFANVYKAYILYPWQLFFFFCSEIYFM